MYNLNEMMTNYKPSGKPNLFHTEIVGELKAKYVYGEEITSCPSKMSRQCCHNYCSHNELEPFTYNHVQVTWIYLGFMLPSQKNVK